MIESAGNMPLGPTFEYSISSATVASASHMSGNESRLAFTVEAADLVLSAENATPFNQMWAYMARTLVALMRGDMPGVAAMYEHFLPLQNRHAFVMSGNQLLGMTALAAGDPDLAAIHLEEAISFSGEAGFRPQEAWSLHDYAALLLDRDAPGDREKATELQDEAIAIATDLGMKLLLERVLAQRSASGGLKA
jgi:hypothetical protein